MKIAALILAHHKPESLSNLLAKLKSWDCNQYIHLDRKARDSDFAELLASGLVNHVRLSASWGSWTLVHASLLLLKEALADQKNTHFYLMSGQCYPIKSAKEIKNAIFCAKHGGNFISYEKMPGPTKSLDRLERWNLNRDNAAWAPVLAQKIARRALPRRPVKGLLRGLTPYSGAQWWLLSRDAVEGILAFVADNPWYLEAFRYSNCSDEIFFQTLFCNLGFVADADCPTATIWQPGAKSPDTIDERNIDQVSGGWHFAARKFDLYYPGDIPSKQFDD